MLRNTTECDECVKIGISYWSSQGGRGPHQKKKKMRERLKSKKEERKEKKEKERNRKKQKEKESTRESEWRATSSAKLTFQPFN